MSKAKKTVWPLFKLQGYPWQTIFANFQYVISEVENKG
ncbi:hypothetical protein pah_c022o058 [Parachlamydia acanthamoebae str. Hall's coccus]|nr:hypothetical protein pah_c022o058 [Parachlamydia acanthamoebae str. Hall's coccus]